MPRLPSGRLDENLLLYSNYIAGTGDVPSVRTDRRDVGKYVARIIADPRTLNRKVLAYTDLRTHNEVYDTVEKLSNEKITRIYVLLPRCYLSSPFPSAPRQTKTGVRLSITIPFLKMSLKLTSSPAAYGRRG